MEKLAKQLSDHGYAYLLGTGFLTVMHFYDNERRCRIVYIMDDGKEYVEAQGPKAFIDKVRR